MYVVVFFVCIKGVRLGVIVFVKEVFFFLGGRSFYFRLYGFCYMVFWIIDKGFSLKSFLEFVKSIKRLLKREDRRVFVGSSRLVFFDDFVVIC